MPMTSQQQLNAFLEHCATIRSRGYILKFNRKTSSLRVLIEYLEKEIADGNVHGRQREREEQIIGILKQYHPKDHVKYVPAVKSLLAVWGTNNNYVQLEAGMKGAVITRYWDPAQDTLQEAACGIAISSRYPGYHSQVHTHLKAIYQSAAGQTFLDELAGAGAKRTSIVDHELSNQCGSHGSTAGLNAVAKELFPENETKLGPACKAALALVNPGGLSRNAWLAREINRIPKYKLKGPPVATPANIGVTTEQVAKWIDNNESIWTDYGNDDACNAIKQAVMVALYDTSAKGAGCGSMVNYCMGDSNPMNAERPPAIGLSHELIHAYYNLRGEQPGFEVENFSTVLFEYRCVGLGPWSTAAISENKIRDQWRDTLQGFPESDTRNRKIPSRRLFYSPP
jgi:hypothetical protein